MPAELNVHWIIVDDCSTEPLSLDGMNFQSMKVTLLRNEINLGKQNCLNKAFDLIQCGYVTVIDSDDYPLNNMLVTFERSINLLNDLGVNASSVSFLNVDESNGEVIGDLFDCAITIDEGVNGGYRINKFDRHGFFTIDSLGDERFPVDNNRKDFISESYLWFNTWSRINVGLNIITKIVRYQSTGYSQMKVHLRKEYRLNQRKYFLKKIKFISIPSVRLKSIIRFVQTFLNITH